MATKTTVINMRTNAGVKKAANKVFIQMGMDLSTGINVYLTRVAQDKALPFTLRTVNGFTPEAEMQILRETARTEKNGKRYRTVEDALKAIS